MDKALYEEMYRLEKKHWWFAAKRQIVFSILGKFFPVNGNGDNLNYSVCDLGCGCGITLSELKEIGYNVLGVDSNQLALNYCKARGVKADYGELENRLELDSNSIDAVLLLDVLEHIDDESKALKEALRILKPNGILICTVPAYQWLWTKRDVYHHHKRRYSRKSLMSTLKLPYADIRRITYINTFLFPVALAERLLRKFIFVKSSPGDIVLPPSWLNAGLKSIFAAERFVINAGISFPFGLSLLAVLCKCSEQKT
jgi:2-polyprenyl-3-methyl-5-hydroxy-6-metoxy-1,4-benzoquinol methylase